jgi:hypothetical protein
MLYLEPPESKTDHHVSSPQKPMYNYSPLLVEQRVGCYTGGSHIEALPEQELP